MSDPRPTDPAPTGGAPPPPGPGPAPRPPGPGPAPRPFVVHRGPGGGPEQGLTPEVRRKVVLLALFSLPAVIYALVLLVSGARGTPPAPVLPKVVDRVKLGMTLAELEALGGAPDRLPDADEGEVRSLRLADPPVPPMRFGLDVSCRVRFDRDGRLEAFAADARIQGLRGAPIGRDALLRVVAGGGLRTAADLEGSLGPGLRVALLLDAAGRTEVFRWTGEDRRSLDALVRDGRVLKLEDD